MNYFARNEAYWGKEFQAKLKKVSISIIGLGGVGGFALEALVRVGVENITIADFDTISETNINRQIIATTKNIGKLKTEEWKKRLLEINPNLKIKAHNSFIENDIFEEVFMPKPNYIVDAIDTLKSKLDLIQYAKNNNIKIITSLGVGNRIDATKLKIVDIKDAKGSCNFSKNIIKNLKNLGIIANLPVVISEEKPKNIDKIKNIEKIKTKSGEFELIKYSPASISTVPAVCGYLIANYIILDIYKNFN